MWWRFPAPGVAVAGALSAGPVSGSGNYDCHEIHPRAYRRGFAQAAVNHGPDVARKGWNVLTEKDGTSSWIRTGSRSLPPRKQGKGPHLFRPARRSGVRRYGSTLLSGSLSQDLLKVMAP